MTDAIGSVLTESGLALRGGFDFAEGEPAPPGPRAGLAGAVLLVGHAGDSYWPHFQHWLSGRARPTPDPLDTWSRAVIGAVAARFGARAVSPSDRPYLPFQQWAMRAEGLRPSPLGILMHPAYGLWHAYRGALLFDGPLGLLPPEASNHLCDACDGKACLNACPVEAYSPAGYAVDSCRGHISSPVADCLARGCRARNACPAGEEYRYRAEVQEFHMKAFSGR